MQPHHYYPLNLFKYILLIIIIGVYNINILLEVVAEELFFCDFDFVELCSNYKKA